MDYDQKSEEEEEHSYDEERRILERFDDISVLGNFIKSVKISFC